MSSIRKQILALPGLKDGWMSVNDIAKAIDKEKGAFMGQLNSYVTNGELAVRQVTQDGKILNQYKIPDRGFALKIIAMPWNSNSLLREIEAL